MAASDSTTSPVSRVQQPTRTQNPHMHVDNVEEHPAYAQIAASRVSGSSFLYVSDFKHHHYVTISIKRSVMNRSLSRDWPFAREEYIEVALSESQWATFVSSLNAGQGVCCTLRHMHGKLVPELPAPESRSDQFAKEAEEDAAEALAALRTLADQIEQTPMTQKAKATLLAHVHTARRKLDDSIPFVANSFAEHVEDVSEAAKIEINAHVQAVIARAGIAALNDTAPFELPEGDGK
jgi:aryl-alcohol dehydrogenase-like predicted oxidoreductase